MQIRIYGYIILINLLLFMNLGLADNVLEKEFPINSARIGEKISGQVVSSGGSTAMATNLILNGTIGQMAKGHLGNETNDIYMFSGFWQHFDWYDCEPGEADGISPINILDIVYLINYKYKSGPVPIPQNPCSGDPNLDCSIDILDIVYLINYKYKQGPPPGTRREWVIKCNFK